MHDASLKLSICYCSRLSASEPDMDMLMMMFESLCITYSCQNIIISDYILSSLWNIYHMMNK